MAIEQFGKTWWGEKWLQSLTQIDYSNRLPRGKSYARTGKVSGIKIKKGTVRSTVKGSRPRPYQVDLKMPVFTAKEMNHFIDKCLEYPTIVSRLLNGKMDPLILEVAEDCGLQIFPETSNDMEMECSCPDWAVPCKHIAGTIYKICSDIDNNPFVLFHFRNAGIQALLKKRNIDLNKIQQFPLEQYNEFLNHHLETKTKKEVSEKHEIPTVDLSALKNRSSSFFQLLQPFPPFYKFGDFKSVYEDIVGRIGKEVGRILSEKVSLGHILNESGDTTIDADSICLADWDEGALGLGGIDFSTVFNIPINELDRYHPSIAYYHLLIRLALHCINKGLVMPKMLAYEDSFLLLWLPAQLDDQLDQIVKKLPQEYGATLFSGKQKVNPSLTLGLLISHLIYNTYDHLIKNSKGIRTNDYTDLFFGGHEVRFDGLSESSIGASINRWLQLFYFDLGNYYPILEINEKKGIKFHIDISIGQTNKGLAKPMTFSSFVKKTKSQDKRFDLFKDLDLLSMYLPEVGDYINALGATPMQFNERTFPKFLFDVSPVMSLLGIKVILPKSLNALIKPKSSVRISSSKDSPSGILGLSALLSFDWRVSLGDEVIPASQFKKLVQHADQLTQYKGSYIYINEGDLLKLNKQLLSDKKFSNLDLLRIALSQEYEGSPIELTADVKKLIAELQDVKLMKPPSKLKATLRPYQQRGYSWLVKNAKIGIGSIIADDMGLGKTLQVISLLTHLVEKEAVGKKKALIIVPTSLIPNWESEFQKFAPHIKLFTYYGSKRELKNMADAEVVLTSYGTIRSDIEKIKKGKWALTIIDESQNIKNPTAQQTKAIKSIPSVHRIAMSGTPVENRLMDYWSVMDFVNKNLLGNKTSFNKNYSKPITREGNQEVLTRFNKITQPFLLRRMKTDKTIISDLPDKITNDVSTVLTPAQSALYQKVLDESIKLISDIDQSDRKELFKRQGLVLQMILALKQICNHPAQWLKDGQMGVELSGKLSLLMDTVQSILDAGEKVLIFTQFREMGDIMEHNLMERLGVQALWLHGGVSMKKRKEMVDAFQNMPHKKIMILSIKAGGTGLNLTAANHVIHYDLWWNPAVEAQATDRAFRIGQKKNVFVHRLITKNTFEEKINDLINSKKELAEMTVSSGEKWIGDLSNMEIDKLFNLD